MKRSLVVTGALLLTALLLFIPSSGTAQTAKPAQTTDPDINRGFAKITRITTPRRDRTRPYTFRTRGRIIPPGRFCSIGELPTRGANCVPIVCLPGSTDLRYCFRPGRGVICSGTVNVRYQKRTTTVSSRNVKVRPDCTYRSRVSFDLRLRTRRGVLRVRARFGGNAVLLPATSRTSRVRAG